VDSLKITSGVEVFDDFLEGGYDKDILTTIYGPASSGKTTLCMLAAIAQAKKQKKVLFIDTEGGFSIERMKQLCGDELDKILSNIIIIKPIGFEEQSDMLGKIEKSVNSKFGLVIVDTITIFYRLEMARTSDFKEINSGLIQQLSYLTSIARKKDIPVIITNQVYSDFGKRDDVKMVGGQILEYSSKCIIKLQNLRENKRKAILMTHRSIAEGKELEFAIINEGIIGSN
jgi:DNA repair protein RadB